MEPAALKRIAIVAVAAVAVVVAAVLWRDRGLEPPTHVPVLGPDDVRIKVEVLNASGQRGLARRATFALRDAGFDVGMPFRFKPASGTLIAWRFPP